MRFITNLLVGLILWPLEALAVMWGLGILNHYDFDVPAPGYWSCFYVALALSLIYRGATLSAKITDDL